MMHVHLQRRRGLVLGLALLLTTALLLLLGASLGSTGVQWPWDLRNDATAWQIVWEIRLPRSLGAWLAGALLGLSGAVTQGLFRNPLADPYLLGSASGAALGVATALVLLGGVDVGVGAGPALAPWLRSLGLTGAAFTGAVAAALLTLALARGAQHTLRLLLSGVVVSVVLGALSSLVMSLAPEVMQALQAFTLGSTGFVDWHACGVMAVVLLVGVVVAWICSHVLDGLVLGEASAVSLGLPVSSLRAVLVMVMALATGTAVAQTGLIGFVGLAAPHLVRARVKASYGVLILLSGVMGGVLLMAADTMARSLLAPQELPVGVLTAVLGGSYLLALMHREGAAQKGRP